jgi:pimeloyl-ACP methyl ester carboxylesterase
MHSDTEPKSVIPEAGPRRRFLAGAAAAVAASTLPPAPAQAQSAAAGLKGTDHWTTKRAGNQDVKLSMWRKRADRADKGTILFVHGSSMAGTPVFDLQVPGKPEYSTMDTFARLGYDTWCLDHEGYGRSDKSRPINADIANGDDDLAAVSEYITGATGQKQLLVYGISSGALRGALFAQRHPERVSRLALDAFVWTGEGSPTLANRRKRLDEYRANNRRAIDRAMVRSIFTRDHPGTADPAVVDAFADAVLALDTTVPSGTYIDMSANLPLVNPELIKAPTLIMRGQFDGIAGFQDLVNFFVKLPNPDKQFSVMPGIAHSSLHEKNVAIVYHILHGFFTRPAPIYVG